MNSLFFELGRSVLVKTLPSVLSMVLGHRTQDLGPSFSRYGPTCWQITFIDIAVSRKVVPTKT